jgi:multimeric flavodoxin WrbA
MQASDSSQLLAINGSPRPGGNSDQILNWIAERQGASAHKKLKIINLIDLDFKACIACEKCRKAGICTGLQDGLTPCYQDIIDAAGLILVSPTHNYNITALMKAFIDRLYCFYHFDPADRHNWQSRLAGQNRKAMIIGICEQISKEDMGFTLPAMRLPLEALGYDVKAELPVFGVFKKSGLSAKIRESVRRLAEEVFLEN